VSFVNKSPRIFFGALALFLSWFAFSPSAVHATQKSHAPCTVIVVGYVGGLDFPSNPYSGIVQIRERLKKMAPDGLCVETFSAYTWWHGYDWLMKRLKESSAETPSAGAGEVPKIIVYGHSLGGWATISLSRRLAAKNIPVELTVQVDSVGLVDGIVPSNVKEAANYYRQAVLPPYGRHKISAKDSGATELLGNFHVAHANHLSVTQAPAISDLIVSTAVRLSATAD
jgi:pimeloyl-ACP methyl ester carboxylesterase